MPINFYNVKWPYDGNDPDTVAYRNSFRDDPETLAKFGKFVATERGKNWVARVSELEKRREELAERGLYVVDPLDGFIRSQLCEMHGRKSNGEKSLNRLIGRGAASIPSARP